MARLMTAQLVATAVLTTFLGCPCRLLQAAQGASSQTLELAAAPQEVKLYRGRAAVRRRAEVKLTPGVHTVVFTGLPARVLEETLRARVHGPAELLDVRYQDQAVTKPHGDRLAKLAARLTAQRQELDGIARQYRVLSEQEAFLDAVTVRAKSDATTKGGTPDLDLNTVREQYRFLSEKRAEVLEARGRLQERERQLKEAQAKLLNQYDKLGTSKEQRRAARVSILARGPEESTAKNSSVAVVNIELDYLVSGASWEPIYTVRAAYERTDAALEYDALIKQDSGEAWSDVVLTVSTEPVLQAGSPPELAPSYVQIRPSQSKKKEDKDEVPEDDASLLPALEQQRILQMNVGIAGPRAAPIGNNEAGPGKPGATARVAESALPPVLSHRADHPVHVPSGTKAHRVRIALLRVPAELRHVAVPELNDGVYVRGDFVNKSGLVLLAGPVSIFLGQDFVGTTGLPQVVRESKFSLDFGVDQAVRATRKMVDKRVSKAGFFGSSRAARYNYRTEIINHTGRKLLLELWDRRPVSRSDAVEITVDKLTHPLSLEKRYREEDAPRGLLKWLLKVPEGKEDRLAVSYAVRVEYPEDVELAGLP